MAIDVNGKTYRNLPEQVEENANQIEGLKAQFSTLGTVMRYKGSVATYADLPTEDLQIGDVYNVLDTGSNYAWDGEQWDEIGSTVDLSGLVTLDTDQTITGVKTFDKQIDFTNENSNTIKYNIEQNSAGQFVISRTYGGTKSAYWKIDTNKLLPNTDNTNDIGSSSSTIKDLYLSGNAYVGGLYPTGNTNNGFTYDSVTYGWRVNANFSPLGNNARDLGRNGGAWKDLYLGGNIEMAIDGAIKSGGAVAILLKPYTFRTYAFGPLVDDAYDIGYSNLKYKNLYLSGYISDGTNSVTVADLTWKSIDPTGATFSFSNQGSLYWYVITLPNPLPAGIKEANVTYLGTIYPAVSIRTGTNALVIINIGILTGISDTNITIEYK